MSARPRLDPDGAQLFPAGFDDEQLRALEAALAGISNGRPGARLSPTPGLAELIRPACAIVATILGSAARPVRATLFDKGADRNWALGWHQDRTIAVRERREAPGFTLWTLKDGIHHVVPPFELLGRMLTLRIHIDPAGPGNAPLLIAPGSHRLGRIGETDIPAVIDRLGRESCPAERGDVWLYATPILHSSQPAACPSRRRVLQLLYSADELPNGLGWLGVQSSS